MDIRLFLEHKEAGCSIHSFTWGTRENREAALIGSEIFTNLVAMEAFRLWFTFTKYTINLTIWDYCEALLELIEENAKENEIELLAVHQGTWKHLPTCSECYQIRVWYARPDVINLQHRLPGG